MWGSGECLLRTKRDSKDFNGIVVDLNAICICQRLYKVVRTVFLFRDVVSKVSEDRLAVSLCLAAGLWKVRHKSDLLYTKQDA